MKELSLHLLDIAENGIRAGADIIELQVIVEPGENKLILKIQDNGNGLDEDTLELVSNPFYTSRKTRKVGMGLPLLKQHAEATGGHMKLSSEKGKGTLVIAAFELDHVDRQPLGDIESCWMILAAANPQVDVRLSLKSDRGEFEIGSVETRHTLEVDHLQDNELGLQLKRLIRNRKEELFLSLENIDS